MEAGCLRMPATSPYSPPFLFATSISFSPVSAINMRKAYVPQEWDWNGHKCPLKYTDELPKINPPSSAEMHILHTTGRKTISPMRFGREILTVVEINLAQILRLVIWQEWSLFVDKYCLKLILDLIVSGSSMSEKWPPTWVNDGNSKKGWEVQSKIQSRIRQKRFHFFLILGNLIVICIMSGFSQC